LRQIARGTGNVEVGLEYQQTSIEGSGDEIETEM
jgi:hypothetical protein